MPTPPTPSNLDFEQCIRGAYEDDTGRLRVDAQITAPLSVNGEVLVDIRATDGDSVLIVGTEDATTTGTQHVVKVNSDGSINVNASITPVARTIFSQYSAITSVPSSSLTTILTHTVGALTEYMNLVEVSGNNIAQFEVYINGILNARQRTYFGGALNTTFNYSLDSSNGLALTTGNTLEVKVIHNRPSLGAFEARLLYAE